MKKLFKICSSAVVAAAFAVPGAVNSATESADFEVRLTILANCQITAEDIDFGTYSVGVTGQYDMQGDVEVSCASATTPYTVSLSTGASGNYAARELRQSPVLVVNYNLYTEAARTNVWGDGSGATVTQASDLSSQVQQFTAYGRVDPSQPVTPGVYVDTITATVEF